MTYMYIMYFTKLLPVSKNEDVNAKKQICMIVILEFLLMPLLNRIENAVELLKLTVSGRLLTL